MDLTDVAYTAGILDGEGCIFIYKYFSRSKKQYYGVRVAIGNTDRTLIEWLTKTWGGKIYRGITSSKKDKPWWQVRIMQREECKKLLGSTLPFLKVKKLQAELALGFLLNLSFDSRFSARGRITESILSAREVAWCEMKKLNKRGI